jgi:hypothetical protein
MKDNASRSGSGHGAMNSMRAHADANRGIWLPSPAPEMNPEVAAAHINLGKLKGA